MKHILIGLLITLTLFTVACDAESQIETKPTEVSGGSFYLSDADTFKVATPYCTLKYPVKWENFVATEIREKDALYSVSYYAKLNGEQIPLFTIEIGEKSEGFELGTIETETGAKKVFMIDRSDEFAGNLSTDDEARFMEMCEDVNVIISCLVNESGMLLP